MAWYWHHGQTTQNFATTKKSKCLHFYVLGAKLSQMGATSGLEKDIKQALQSSRFDLLCNDLRHFWELFFHLKISRFWPCISRGKITDQTNVNFSSQKQGLFLRYISDKIVTEARLYLMKTFIWAMQANFFDFMPKS